MSLQSSAAAESIRPVIVGIDWGDLKHDVCVIHGDGRPSRETLQHDPQTIVEWIDRLRKTFPNRPLLIAIEQSRGGLAHALQEDEGLTIYPINPKQLASYRNALFPAGGKNDTNDAELLALLLLNHPERFRPWQPDDNQTQRLAYLSELRRNLVEERKRLGLRLLSTLKLYFPLALSLFGKSQTSEFLVDLIKRWPSLNELKRAHPSALRQFFKSHAVRDEDRQTEWINAIRSATPITSNGAIIQTHSLYAQSLIRQIAELNRAVAQFDEELRHAVAQHPDEPIFRAVPGAGDAIVPRLIAAFGSDRNRYHSAQDLQTYSGIAPITLESGQSRCVLQRFACPRFLKQTFHEFADQARRWSPWSKAYYDFKRSHGMKHQAAIRALAFKWIRILFSLWKNNAVYSEANYIKRLIDRKSPFIACLEKI